MNRLVAILLCMMASGVHAHSLHQSTAEAEYNSTTKKLEVSLTVFINDLELALIRQTEREMRLDKTPATQLDAEIQTYLAKTFIVTDAAGNVSMIEWVGRKLDVTRTKSGDPAVTLFFEIALPDGLPHTALRHVLFHDLFKDQINLLHLRNGSRKVQLSFTRTEASKKLVFTSHPQ